MKPEAYRRIRQNLQLSIRALAEQLGVDKGTIVRREHGHVPITRETEYALRYLIEMTEREKVGMTIPARTRAASTMWRPV